jgi:hypothetical protein
MKLFDSALRFLVNIKQPLADDRRIMLEEEAKEVEEQQPHLPQNSIMCNGKLVYINWNKIIKHTDLDAMVLPKNCYKTVNIERNPNMFVAHWDVCLSSKSCFNVLKKRKLSVHFLIDNDGTIHQIMDTNHIAYHAGNRKVNNNSIGVEISNGYYPRYQNIYVKRGFGERPVLKKSEVHGRTLEPHLGFYPEQKKAFAALAEALNRSYNIPLEVPMKDGKQVKTVYRDAYRGTFKGIVNHYHITKRKIDCAGFDIQKILNENT